MKKQILITVSLLLLALAVVLGGCGKKTDNADPDDKTEISENEESNSASEDDDAERDGENADNDVENSADENGETNSEGKPTGNSSGQSPSGSNGGGSTNSSSGGGGSANSSGNSGGGASNSNGGSSKDPSADKDRTAIVGNLVSGSDTYTIKEYAINTSKNNISWEYPVLSGKTDGISKANELIYNKAADLSKRTSESTVNGAAVTADFDSTVSLLTDRLVSVMTVGTSSAGDSMHPTSYCYAQNIDLETGREITLKDKFKVSAPLAKTVRSAFLSHDADYIREYFKNSLSDSDVQTMLTEPQMFDTQTYFTENGLGISLTVPHALGDHAEAVISYSQVAQYVQK